MPNLSFTVAPDEVGRLGDTISCLAKFSEIVSIEAQPDNVTNLRSPFQVVDKRLILPAPRHCSQFL